MRKERVSKRLAQQLSYNLMILRTIRRKGKEKRSISRKVLVKIKAPSLCLKEIREEETKKLIMINQMMIS